MQDKKIERRIKFALIIIAAAVCALYAANRWTVFQRLDNPPPEITFDEELLLVSVNASQEELLQGVRAVDTEDGDVSVSIMIESMSNLLEGNQRIVTYAAFDGDNHVGKAERRIQYTDYSPIRFSLPQPIEGTDDMELAELLAPLKAYDCIDGDISNQIVVVDHTKLEETDEYVVRAYQVQVTNSCGEVATLALPVKISDDGADIFGRSEIIELSDYLVYCKTGDYLNLDSYLANIDLELDEDEMYSLEIDSELDTSVPGAYMATYTVTWEDHFASRSLIIVVEE